MPKDARNSRRRHRRPINIPCHPGLREILAQTHLPCEDEGADSDSYQTPDILSHMRDLRSLM